MHAARYRGEHTIDYAEVEPVALPSGHVRIDVAFTGICGTDLHILHGDMDQRVTLPAILGHEMSGVVSAVGDDVEGWSTGDRATVMPLVWCGDCPACAAGNSHICQNLNFVGIDSPGAMQNSWTIPADILVRLPDELPLDQAALIEPVAVAVHDVRRADIAPGQKVVVVGGGPVGVLVACVARAAGAEVLVLEVDAHRRQVIEGLHLTVHDPLNEDVPSLVASWTAGAGASVTFEVSGSQAGLDTAVDVLGVRGRLVLVAIHPTPRPVNLHRFFWRELTLVGARVYQREDFERAVQLVASGEVAVEALISRVVPLSDAAAAFAALEAGGGVMKVLVNCQTT